MQVEGDAEVRAPEESPVATGRASQQGISRMAHRLWSSDGLRAAAIALAATLVAWLRLDPVTRHTIWAEDGSVFLTQASHAGLFETVLLPYAGYLHVVPRLITEVTTMFAPIMRYAVVMNGLACAVAGGVAGLVYVCSRDVVDSRLLRVGLAAITVLVPSLPREVLGNLANLHWFFLWLAPWLLLYKPRTRTGSVLLGVVALAGALTEIQMALFLPLALWGWRERRGWPVRLGLLAGIAAQLATLTHAPRPIPSGTPLEAGTVATGYLVNAVMTLWSGSASAITHLITATGWSVPVIAAMASVAAVLMVVRRGTPVQRRAAVAFPIASIIIWTAAWVVNHPPYLYDRPGPDSAAFAIPRYAPVPSMFVLAGLLLALATISWRRWWTRIAIAALGVPLAVAAVTTFAGQPTERSQGPVWFAQVAAARESCRVHPDTEPDFLVAPNGWLARTPCALVEGR